MDKMEEIGDTIRAYQLSANKYFKEYKGKNIEELKDDNIRWREGAKVINTMTIGEKADYADYVISKICENESDKIVYGAYLSIKQIDSNTPVNVAAIGNVAKLSLELYRRDFKKESEELENMMYKLKINDNVSHWEFIGKSIIFTICGYIGYKVGKLLF